MNRSTTFLLSVTKNKREILHYVFFITQYALLLLTSSYNNSFADKARCYHSMGVEWFACTVKKCATVLSGIHTHVKIIHISSLKLLRKIHDQNTYTL